MKIVTAARMREIDQECIRRGTPVSVLMENAGKAVAEETRRLLGDIAMQHIVCLTGAGNNGGDALVAGRYLHQWGVKTTVCLCSARPDNDENLKLLKDLNIDIVEITTDKDITKLDGLLETASCAIDGLLGTGKMRPLEGILKTVLEKTSAAKAAYGLKIVAVDLPSGMDADTGAIDPACPAADITVTLALPKPGLYRFPGAEMAGKAIISDIGIPAELAEDSTMELLTPDWAAKALPPRPDNANKGTFGKALVCAGSANYIGAAYLACSGALRSGAGLVTLAAPKSLTAIIAAKTAETTYLPLPETEPGAVDAKAADIIAAEYPKYNALLIGCGLGQSHAVIACVSALLQKADLPPLVIDADGLNIIAALPDWPEIIPDNAILTPHPGEMSRLTGLSVHEIQQNRAEIAVEYAQKWRKTVILKGAYTVIAAPDGTSRISPYANPGLASAGTGDVLAGIIGGLAAQGVQLYDAAALGVYLHGEAGERVRAEMGDTGMTASDLLPVIPKVIKDLKALL